MKFELPEEVVFLKNSKAEQKVSTTSMENKLCIITGGTSGVGLEAIRRFAKGLAHIVMICRNKEKAEAVVKEIKSNYNVDIEYFIADFEDLTSVKNVAKAILETYPKIDVLVNNAGMHSTTKQYTAKGIEKVFCVNHLASFILTYLLISRLKENSRARVIQINSEGHRFNGLDIEDINWNKRIYTGLRGYGAAKTAQLLTMWEFNDMLKSSGVTINAVHPGEVRTNIGSNNGWLYRWFTKNITGRMLKSPDIAGEAIYYIASTSDMEGVSGNFYNLTIEEKPAIHALDREASKRVWDISIEMAELGGDELLKII